MIFSIQNFIRFAVLVAFMAFATFAKAESPPPSLLAGKRVVWLGDSITQDGKYVSFIEYYLNKKFPEQRFDFISIGLGSETVSGLTEKKHPFPRPCVFERLSRALKLTKPEIVIACYGLNDGIYHPQNAGRTKAFQDGIQRLSIAVRTNGAQLILLTPPPFDPRPIAVRVLPVEAPDFGYDRPFTNYNDVMIAYAKYEVSLPTNVARAVVDLHSALNQFIGVQREKNPQFTLAPDGVHLAPAGHLLMALTFLEAFGLKTEVADLEAELARLNADPLFELIRERREQRSKGWLEYVGYTRDKTVKKDSVSETEEAAAAIQRKIDEMRK